MIQDLDHFITDLLKSIPLKLLVDVVFGLAMTPEIEEEYIVVFFEISNLFEPDTATTTSPMDKSDPLSLRIAKMCSIVKHESQS